MLASTVQFSSYGRPHQVRPPHSGDPPAVRDQGNARPNHGPRPSGPNSVPTPTPPREGRPPPTPTTREPAAPTRTHTAHRPAPPPTDTRRRTRTRPTPQGGHHSRCSTHEHHPQHTRPGRWASPPPHPHPPRGARDTRSREKLLRKEVIQPHLPVRLPCYDLVPIASPTFDGSPPQGVGPPASGVTDFRDLTGGVYKARERIHRSVADLRLLATPTSWGRVADPNPN